MRLGVGAFIGLIADTHGLLRPEARAALDGASLILHAGDIGAAPVCDALRAIAPLVAVRGNVDRGPWAEALPLVCSVPLDLAGLTLRVWLCHVAPDAPPDGGTGLIVAGHSHQWRDEQRGAWRFINPGSAGPRRFRLPVTLGRLRVCGPGSVVLERVGLVPDAGAV